ncbi:hypothetical protein [Micromonospora sp. 4G55]|uniref:hypothetical protein n=1 Tax=Micromonospora sp. 4G55 TaxID=2806102 RepID=UPI001A43774E|nr:hypothetical protein [Micromonospora sp. 4G55]MBM0258165.1 hypothetical protein [Micromonospora sp. 4G55]
MAIVEASHETDDVVEAERLARATNLGHDSVQRALQVLSSYGDLFFRSVLEPDRRTVVYVNHVTVHARRAAEGGLLLEVDGVSPPPGPPDRKLAGRVVKVVGAVLGAIAAKIMATLVSDAVHRP